ncbi:hypothetical protein, partial [Vibrio parahaemolyticus]|uniref:hypothetical protein n=1 Tax=Vibrio parahaemolyticus TaxID=670 RepID=UPI001C60E36C
FIIFLICDVGLNQAFAFSSMRIRFCYVPPFIEKLEASGRKVSVSTTTYTTSYVSFLKPNAITF